MMAYIMMHRTQILLEQWHYEPRTALMGIAGIGKDPDLRAQDHDRVLYGGKSPGKPYS